MSKKSQVAVYLDHEKKHDVKLRSEAAGFKNVSEYLRSLIDADSQGMSHDNHIVIVRDDKIKYLENCIEEWRNRDHESQGIIEELRRAGSHAEDDRQKLQDEVNRLDSQLLDITHLREDFDKQIEELTSNYESQIEEKSNELSEEIDSLRDLNNNLNRDIKNSKSEVDRLRQSIKYNSESSKNKDVKIDSLNKTITDLTNSCNQKDLSISELQSSLEHSTDNQREAVIQFNECQDENNKIYQSLELYKDKVDKLGSEVDTLNSRLNYAHDRITYTDDILVSCARELMSPGILYAFKYLLRSINPLDSRESEVVNDIKVYEYLKEHFGYCEFEPQDDEHVDDSEEVEDSDKPETE